MDRTRRGEREANLTLTYLMKQVEGVCPSGQGSRCGEAETGSGGKQLEHTDLLLCSVVSLSMQL